MTGYTAYEDDVDTAYNTEETYGQDWETEYDEDEEGYLVMSFALLCDDGLDFQNDEACALAAESLQLEQEAYMLRAQGKGKGHSGFRGERQFDVKGSVSFHERKARLAQLKSRTECRRCGQKGHWSGDSVCPKGGRKGGGKKSNRSSPTSSPTASGKHGGNGKNYKPRAVYFSMAEDEKATTQGPRVAMMAYRGARPKASSGGRAIPPPECLNAAPTTSMSSPTASSHSSSMAMAAAPISMLSSLIPSIASNPDALPDREAIERAWRMQQAVRQEVGEQEGQGAGGDDGALQAQLDEAKSADDVRVAGALQALAWMEVDEEAGREGEVPIPQPSNLMVTHFPLVGTPERQRHLDRFLELVDQSHPDWTDAFNERWNEFYPGHVMFVDSDLLNFNRWQDKATKGEPKLPEPQSALEDAPQRDIVAGGTSEVRTSSRVTPSAAPSTSTTTSPPPAPSMAPSAAAGECLHQRTTKKGTNKHVEMVTCLDCHCVISKVKKTLTAEAAPPRQPVDPQLQAECPHTRVTWRGSNAFQWRRTCRDCGHMTCGYNGAAGPRPVIQQGEPSPGPVGAPGRAEEVGGFTVEQMKNIFQTCHVVSCVKAMENPSQVLSGAQLHRILDAVVASTQAQTSTVAQPPVQLARPRGYLPQGGKLLNFGEFKGRTFEDVYRNNKPYVDWCENAERPSSCKGLKEFVAYCKDMKRGEAVGFMALEDAEEPAAMEDHLIAVLDLGCNRTCHGDRWMERYMRAVGNYDVPITPDEGNTFKGIGGQIATGGIRHMNVSFQLDDGGMAVGDLHSIELMNSDAPLLLSITDQRKLGLVVTLGLDGDKVYSEKLDAYLTVTQMNGLLGVRILPSDLALLGFEEAVESDGAEHLESPKQEDEPSFVPLRSQSQQQQPEDEVEMPVALASEQELCQYEKFLDVSLEPCKVLSKGQKKMISQNVAELDSSDISLWATLKNQKAKTPLPRGCKVFLMEIFAGAAVLTSMALSHGLSVAAPIDILLDGTDLLKESVRKEIDRHIDEQDPYCLTFAPVCGPWSSWSRLNSAKNEQTAADIALQRDLWYPCLRWIRSVIQRRLKRGRKVLVENPWGSELWSTLCMDKLIQEAWRVVRHWSLSEEINASLAWWTETMAILI